MADKPYTVLNVTGRVVLDSTGTPKAGYHIDFRTAHGNAGFVDIPADRFTEDGAKDVIAAEAARLDRLFKL